MPTRPTVSNVYSLLILKAKLYSYRHQLNPSLSKNKIIRPRKMKITMRHSLSSGADCIYIIDCLTDSELQTGITHETTLVDALNNRNNDISHQIVRKKVQTTNDFYKLISEITCNEKVVAPLLCIHGHGSMKAGLLVGKEYIGWHKLINCFTKLIEVKKGNLTIFALFCHSYQLVNFFKAQDHLVNYCRNKYRKLPFAYYYGYETKINAGEIQDETNKIFTSLLNTEHPELFQEIPKLKIKKYSEFDYCSEKVLPILGLFVYDIDNPNISKKNIRDKVANSIRDMGFSFKLSRDYFKNIKQNPTFLFDLIDKLMHPSEVRELYKKDLMRHYFKQKSIKKSK